MFLISIIHTLRLFAQIQVAYSQRIITKVRVANYFAPLHCLLTREKDKETLYHFIALILRCWLKKTKKFEYCLHSKDLN
jgi:hypothetical protein